MEQLIPVIEFLKKNRFWLTCGLVVLASFATWYLAAGALQESRKGFIQKIDSSNQTAQQITRTSAEGVEDVIAHPNAQTKEGMEKQLASSAEALIRVWKANVDGQADILKWPADVLPKGEEAQEFIRVYEQFDPVEAFPGLANQNMGKWLGVYKRNIPKRMLALCNVIGTQWNYDELGELIEPEEPEAAVDDDDNDFSSNVEVPEELPVVVWGEENQAIWNSKLTEFKDRDGQRGVDGIPTPIQVIMLQQDLWLLEAMFTIIKDLNGGADANDLATIKQIHHLAFGREARSQLGILTTPDPRLAKPDGTGLDENSEFSNFPEDGISEAVDENAFDPYPGEGKEQFGPYHGRYVDRNFKPYTATRVQEVLMGKVFPEEDLELLVAKRVPVRIALKMDERKIGDFIAACANSPFAFEIWQVRINRPLDPIELAGSFANLPRTQGADESEYDFDDEFGGLPSSPFGSGVGEESGDESPFVQSHRRNNYDIDVEFYGIVKIYNPVNEDLILNLEANSNQ